MNSLPATAPSYDGNTAVTGAFAVDPSKGELRSEVSRQWAKRPDDQKFLSLDALRQRCEGVFTASREVELDGALVAYEGSRGDIVLGGSGFNAAVPTNWAFSQLCGQLKVPGGYLGRLPAHLAADCLNHGLQETAFAKQRVYLGDNGESIRAFTSDKYARITDAEVVAAVQRVAGNGIGDTRWKVPGVMDWARGMYNPFVPVSMETTTLYGSDRDVFMFLVDDTHPIEVGKLANGNPDLMFRGFYCWNSEVGSRSFGIAMFYMRAVCANRNLWGVEGFTELKVRHVSSAIEMFALNAGPLLEKFSNASPAKVIAGVSAAKQYRIIDGNGHDDAYMENALAFFRGRLEMPKNAALAVMRQHEEEEGRPIISIWDMAQGLTAYARNIPHQDQRLQIERKAKALLDKVNA